MPEEEEVAAGYRLRLCTEADVPSLDGMLRRSLYRWEPLARGLDPAHIPPPDAGHAAALVPQRLSVLAETLDDRRVIGVCLGERPPQSDNYIYTDTDDDRKFQDLFNYMEDESGVVRLAPDAVEIRLIAVDECWRQLGVATRLVAAAEELAASEGYPWLKIYCTSSYSARLLDKLGWRTLYNLSYADYLRERPDCGIRPPPHPHTHATIYVKAAAPRRTFINK